MKNNTALNKIVSIVVLTVLLCATVVGAYLGVFGRNTEYATVVEDGQEVTRALYRQVAFIPNTLNENWREAIRPSAALGGGYGYTLTAEGADSATLNKIAKVAAERARLIAGSAAAKVQDGAVTVTVAQDEYYSLIASCLQTVGEIGISVYDSESGSIGEAVLGAEHIKQAYYSANNSTYYAQMVLNSNGVIYLTVDGSPVAYAYITDLSNDVIAFTASEWSSAFIAVDNFRSGPMPAAVTLASAGEAAATMGGFLNGAIIAVAAVLLAVCVLLVIRCRLNGVIAVWTLCAWLVLFFLTAALVSVSVSWTMDLFSAIVLVVCVACFVYGLCRLFLSAGAQKGLRASFSALETAARRQFKAIGLGCLALLGIGLVMMFIFQSGIYGVLGRFVALSAVVSFVALIPFTRVVAACGKALLTRK